VSKHTGSVRITGVFILITFAVAVVVKYHFLWPVLVFVAISHLPMKPAKQ
jgi:hypothetical protein